MKKIKIYSINRNPILKNRKRLKNFIIKLFEAEKKNLGDLSYIFCSDEYLHGINIEFLKHDFYTDVITFDLGLKDKEAHGEVYISVDRVKENAKLVGVSYKEELHRVIFHGALHLCGYNDKGKGEAKIMKSYENKYLRKYFD